MRPPVSSSLPLKSSPSRIFAYLLLSNLAFFCVASVFFASWRQARSEGAELQSRLDAQGSVKPPRATKTDAAKGPAYQAYGSPGWKAWIQQLRETGVPDEVIARIAIAEASEEWNQQDHKAQARVARGELSLKQYDDGIKTSETIEEKAVRAALGDAGFLRWDMDRVMHRIGATELTMSDEERASLYKIQKAYDADRAEFDLQQQQGLVDPYDGSALQEKSYYEVQDQMRKLLGESRYAVVQSGGDPAMEMRRQLGDFKPTDQQFQQMIEAQKRWSMRHSELDRLQAVDDNEFEDRKAKAFTALEAERKDGFKNALGPDGYAAYVKQQDSRYTMLKQYAPTWGLSPENVENLYGAVTSFEKTMQDARAKATAKEAAGETVDWDAVTADEEKVKQQAEDYFKNILGDERLHRLTKASVLSLNETPES